MGYWKSLAGFAIMKSGLSVSGVGEAAGAAAISAVAGGASSAIAGGSFADGAITGAYTFLYNHMAGVVAQKSATKRVAEEAKKKYGPGQSDWERLASAAKDMLPVAVYYEGDIDLTIGGGGDFSAGFVVILRGPDMGKFVPYTDIGYGSGFDVSGSIGGGYVFYTGDVSNFGAATLNGSRVDLNASLSLGADIGFNTYISDPDVFGGRVMSFGSSFGGGFSPLNILSISVGGNINYGDTKTR